MALIKPIPIACAREICKKYGYDQIIIYARKVDGKEKGGEHMTTYGINKVHCEIAARIGMTLKRFMGWES